MLSCDTCISGSFGYVRLSHVDDARKLDSSDA